MALASSWYNGLAPEISVWHQHNWNNALNPDDYIRREGHVDPWVATKYLLHTQQAALVKLQVSMTRFVHRTTISRWWALQRVAQVGPFKARNATPKNNQRKYTLALAIEDATYGYVKATDILYMSVDDYAVGAKYLPHPKITHRIHPADRDEYAAVLRSLARLVKEHGYACIADELHTTPNTVKGVLTCCRRLTPAQAHDVTRLLGHSDLALHMVRLATSQWG